MAKFLTRSGCTDAIEQMARQSKDKLWLISPFIKITDPLRELLEEKDRDRIDMRLVYGKRELREGELEWLESLASLRMYYRENLHAKCYMTEDVALITSMNLYEYSLLHNDEWGILVSRTKDEELYDKIFDEAQRIFRRSEIPSSVKAPEVARQPTTAQTPSSAPADDIIIYHADETTARTPPPRSNQDRQAPAKANLRPQTVPPQDWRLRKRRRRHRLRHTQAVLRQVFQKLEQVQEPRVQRRVVPRLRARLGDGHGPPAVSRLPSALRRTACRAGTWTRTSGERRLHKGRPVY